MSLRRPIRIALAAALMALAAGCAHAQAWPQAPLRLIHATAPGGGTDVMARALAEKLQARLGQPVVVESRPGASGMLAIAAVRSAPADGQTLLLSFSQIVQNVAQRKSVPYKLEDFEPVSQLAMHPVVLAVGGGRGIQSFDQYIAAAKARPGAVSYGSFGIGSTGHMIGVGLDKLNAMETVHVAYKGDAAAFPDVASGRTDAAFGAMGFYLQMRSAGKAQILAVANPKRMAVAPDVPTLGELGYPQLNVPAWTGIFVRSGTPAAVTQRLSQAIVSIVGHEDFHKTLEPLGFEPVGSPQAVFRKTLEEDLERWTRLVKLTGVEIE